MITISLYTKTAYCGCRVVCSMWCVCSGREPRESSCHSELQTQTEKKMIFDGRPPLKQENFILQTTFDDNLCWKTKFDGRQPLMKEDLCMNTTFDERKKTFHGSNTLMEENF